MGFQCSERFADSQYLAKLTAYLEAENASDLFTVDGEAIPAIEAPMAPVQAERKRFKRVG